MSGQKDGCTLGVHPADEIPYLAAGMGVQTYCRLIQKEKLRSVDESPGNHGASFHAARDVINEVVGMIGQLHIIQELCYALLSICPGKVVQPCMQLQVLGNGQVPVQAEMLLDYAELRLHPCRISDHIYAINPNLPRCGLGEGGKYANGGCLAGSIGSQEAEKLTGLNRQIQAVNHLYARIVLA